MSLLSPPCTRRERQPPDPLARRLRARARDAAASAVVVAKSPVTLLAERDHTAPVRVAMSTISSGLISFAA